MRTFERSANAATIRHPLRSTNRVFTRAILILFGLGMIGLACPAIGDQPQEQTPADLTLQQALEDPRVRAKLEELGVSADAPKNPIANLVKAIMAQPTAGSPEAVSAAAPEAEAEPPSYDPLDDTSVTVSDTGLLDVHVTDTPINTILQMLSYQARTNIVATRSVQGTISANLYGLTLWEALDAILTPNGYVYKQVGKTIFVGSPEDLAAKAPPAPDAIARVFKLRYITKDEAVAAITTLLSADGKVIPGGGENSDSSSSSDIYDLREASSDYVIVTDVPSRMADVEALLRDIDVRPQQVLIEATILRATLNEQNQFGIDFTMLGGVDFQNVNSTSNTSTDISTGATPPTKFEKTTFNVNTDLIGSMPAGGFTFGVIRNSVAGFIRALEEVTDVTVVANPKIIALNKQKAEVIVGRRDGYLTTTVTETAAVQTVEFLETGTQIRFRPFINEDGTVRLAVHPKDSNGGLTAANLPFEETTEATAAILVNDGRTILIGGLFRERTVNSKGQVPVLGNIPGAGLLFQNHNDTTVREEVIILLTVHVVKETEEEYDRHETLLDDIERIRVGSRKGLLGFGRDRLAQAFYQQAVRSADAGNIDRALFCTRMALHNAPKHNAALKLKERLLQKRMWDDEGSRTRMYLLDLIGLEHSSPEQLDKSYQFGRPPLDRQLQYPGVQPGLEDELDPDENNEAQSGWDDAFEPDLQETQP